MIYLFAGNNFKKRQESLEIFLKKQKGKTIRFDEMNFREEEFDSLVNSVSIFGDKPIVVLDNLLKSKFENNVLSYLQIISKSDLVFVFIESEIGKPIIEKIKKLNGKVEFFEEDKINKQKFNIFSITDALGERKKKDSWILLQKALKNNISSEEVLNILIWQVKNLLLVKDEKDIKKTGLAPFVYQKSKKYSENFSKNELVNYSRKLLSLFHESHLGLDVDSNLELFLLRNL